MLLDGGQPAAEGDTLWAGGVQAGVITCAMYSRLTHRSMAIARLDLPFAVEGTPLEVKGSVEVGAKAHTLPFDDPAKTKRTAVG